MAKVRKEPTFEGLLTSVDRILKLRDFSADSAGFALSFIGVLDEILANAGFDSERRRHLDELTARLKQTAARLSQSSLSLKRGGTLRCDWLRFAKHDLIKFKDEILALREFLVMNEDFVEFACSRARKGKPRVDLEKLLNELHEVGAISERTWALLMSRVGEWQKASKDRAVAEKVARISNLFFDLQEARRERERRFESRAQKSRDGNEVRAW